MADTWQAVAHALGARLSHATHCEEHRTPNDDCPYCADVAAYARYVAKVGHDPSTLNAAMRKAVSVPLDQIRTRPAVSGEQTQ